MAEPGTSGPGPEMQPAAELLPVVYAELRRLAAALSARLPPGQTLQPTALVHEAYLRLVGEQDPGWKGCRPTASSFVAFMLHLTIWRFWLSVVGAAHGFSGALGAYDPCVAATCV